MADFSLDVRKFAEKAKIAPEKVAKSVSIKLFSSIILASPVDTGRFRMNWDASDANPSGYLTEQTDLDGQAAIKRITDYITSMSDWHEITMTNNLAYAEVLEFGQYPGDGPNTVGGFSKQAPQGMVRVNIARFESLLEQEAAKYK